MNSQGKTDVSRLERDILELLDQHVQRDRLYEVRKKLETLEEMRPPSEDRKVIYISIPACNSVAP